MTGTPGAGRVGVAIAAGMLKGVYSHGVLAAFEERGLRADVYGTASSSALSGGLAVIGRARRTGAEYWIEAAANAREKGMSRVVLDSIEKYGPELRRGIFRPGAPEYLLATSRVTNAEAAEITRGPEAKSLGKRLLRDAFAGERGWVEENLSTAVFSSHAKAGEEYRLVPENFDAVSYASTRMLHAWETPAEVDGQAYVDASYTCACPAREVAAKGVDTVIAVGSDPFPLVRDLYATEEITDGSVLHGARISVIKPEEDLSSMGVDYATATPEGLLKAFAFGVDAGHRFMDRHTAPDGSLHLSPTGNEADIREESP